MAEAFTVMAIEGSLAEYVENPYIARLQYDDLTEQEAFGLCKLSLRQGYRCVLWMQEAERGEE